MDYAQVTKPGTRATNEDSLANVENSLGSLFVVADGLGAHGKGEVASAIAVETLRKAFSAPASGADTFSVDTFLAEAMLEAQAAILREQQVQRSPLEMKTTCAALLLADGACRTAHVGDTRVYTFYNNKMKTRTIDHSVPQMLALSGEIKEKHIRHHPDRNRLLRVMGVDWAMPQYELSAAVPLAECQAFLLCSDGFWELCSEKKMCAFLKKSGNAALWLDRMTEEVEKQGRGRDMDNYTAIAVFC